MSDAVNKFCYVPCPPHKCDCGLITRTVIIKVEPRSLVDVYREKVTQDDVRKAQIKRNGGRP